MIKSLKTICYVFAFILIVCMCSFGFMPLVSAETANAEYKSITVTNGNFANNPTSVSLDSSPTGWTAMQKDSSIENKRGIINVDNTSSKFDTNCSTNYFLQSKENPSKKGSDNKVLMISSRTATDDTSSVVVDGFTSDSISLENFSYYKLSFYVNTMGGTASAQLKGLEDYELTDSTVSDFYFSNIETGTRLSQDQSKYENSWVKYNYYISTNYETPSIQLVLYLGQVTENAQSPSGGVVFFDEVTLTKYSENEFNNCLTLDSGLTTKNITLKNYTMNAAELSTLNTGFENDLQNTWTKIGTYSTQTYTATNVSVNEIEQGSDFSLNNEKALLLSADENNALYVGYKSNTFTIQANTVYRISIFAKATELEGDATIKFIETEYLKDTYNNTTTEPTTSTLDISTSSTNQLTNDYIEYIFLVKGYELYDTEAYIELALGTESENAYGSIAFDNLKISKYPYEVFNNLDSSLTNTNKVTLTTISGDPTFTNGFFNDAYSDKVEVSYPLIPNNWTQSAHSDGMEFGVVNTTNWDNTLPSASPKNAPLTLSDGTVVNISDGSSNNILMVYNPSTGNQTITSPTFSVSADTYYNVTFNYWFYGNNSLTIKVIDDNDITLYEKDNFETTTAWEFFSITIHSGYASSTLHFEIILNTTESTPTSYAYFDNFQFTTRTCDAETFKTIANTIDLSELGVNLVGEPLSVNNDVYDATMFNGELVSGNQGAGNPIAFGGIITDSNSYGITFPTTHTDSNKNMLVINTTGIADYTLTSKTKISLSSGTYYKFSVYVKANLSTGKDYGAYFNLVGIDNAIVQKIKSTNDFEQFFIYINCDEDCTVQLQFGLNSDSIENQVAFFDTASYETISSDDFKAVTSSNNITLVNSADAEDEDEDEDTTPSDATQVNLWIQIGTIVMILAVFVAIVGAIIRKKKVKHIKIAKQKEYERKATFVHDASVIEAEKRRNNEIAQITKEKEQLNVYLKELEEDNKKRLAEERKTMGKQVTRKAEKEFKLYASNRQKLIRDMKRLDDRIEEVKSDEYLARIVKIVQNEKVDKIIEAEEKGITAPQQIEQETKEEITNKEIEQDKTNVDNSKKDE